MKKTNNKQRGMTMLARLLDETTFDAAKVEFDKLTNELTISILEVDDSDKAAGQREIFETMSKRFPAKSRFTTALQDFVQPKAEDFNTTSNEALLEKASKGTDHHALYKQMQNLSSEQKTELSAKLGVSLTKFAVCSLILLYTEGNKLDASKGGRNFFALARQALSAIYSEPDRNLKLEFFAKMLLRLNGSQALPVDFVSDARVSSEYSKAKKATDADYMAVIKGGVNVHNALALFDQDTLGKLETITPVLVDGSSAYAAGSSALYVNNHGKMPGDVAVAPTNGKM